MHPSTEQQHTRMLPPMVLGAMGFEQKFVGAEYAGLFCSIGTPWGTLISLSLSLYLSLSLCFLIDLDKILSLWIKPRADSHVVYRIMALGVICVLCGSYWPSCVINVFVLVAVYCKT